MPIWSGGGNTVMNGFLRQLAMNEQKRKEMEQRQREQESIRNMFRALGYDMPQGYVNTDTAGTIVNTMTQRERDQADAERRREDAELRNIELLQRRDWDVTDSKTQREQELADAEVRRAQELADAEVRRIRELADDSTDFQQQKDLIDYRAGQEKPTMSAYGNFIIDKAVNILRDGGLAEFEKAIGDDGSITGLMSALDEKEAMLVAQRLNMYEDAAKREAESSASKPVVKPQRQPYQPQAPIPGTGSQSVGQALGGVGNRIRNIRPYKPNYPVY